MKSLVVVLLFVSTLLALPAEIQKYRDELVENHPLLIGLEEEIQRNKKEETLATRQPDLMVGGALALSPIETRVGPQRGVLTVSQKLLFPSLLRAKKATIQSKESILQTRILAHTAILTAEMLTHILNMYEIENKIVLLRDYNRLIKTRVDVVEARYISNSTGRRAVISAELELIRNEDKIKKLEKMKGDKVIAFNTLLGYEKGSDVSVPTELLTIIVPSMDTYQDLNPQLKLFDTRIATAVEKVQLEKELLFPGLTIGGKYLFNGESDMKPAPMENGKDAFQVFVSAPVPFKKRKNSLRVSVQQQKILELKAEKEALDRSLSKQIETLYSALDEEERRVTLSTDRVLPKLIELQENSLELYSTGKLRFHELILVERELMMEKILLLSSRVLQMKIKVEINKLLGVTYEASK